MPCSKVCRPILPLYISVAAARRWQWPSRLQRDLTEQLSAAYRNQLVACFKAGDMAKALGLLDQAKGLQQHVDALFRLPQSL